VAGAARIAEVKEGQVALLSGRVRLAGTEPLVSPIGEKPCVYYEVRAVEGEDSRRAAQDFLLEDETGLALVKADSLAVEAPPDAVREKLSVVDADIKEVSARLGELKETMRSGAPAEQRETLPRLRRLRELATLLCSIRAHARDRIHGGRGTLEDQAAYIRSTCAKFRGAPDVEWVGSFELETTRHEVTLQEGARVTVEGTCRWEPDPDPAAARLYRQIPLRLVVRPLSDGAVRVSGELARAAAAGRLKETPGLPETSKRRPDLWLLAGAAAAVAALLYWLMSC
jgi:hypothetical protein